MILSLLWLACSGKDDDTPTDGPTTPSSTGDTGVVTTDVSGVVWILSGAEILAGTASTSTALATLSAAPGDATGIRLHNLGSVDGDPYDELVVGMTTGKVSVVPGSVLRAGGAIDVLTQGSVVALGGTLLSVASGDFDVDNDRDLIAARLDWNGTAEASTIAVFTGSALLPVSTFTLSDAIASVDDPLAEQVGASVAGVDVDGDGLDELIASVRYDGVPAKGKPVPGRVDVYPGTALNGAARLDPTFAIARVHGDLTTLLSPLTGAGDADADGRFDVWSGPARYAATTLAGDITTSQALGRLAVDARPMPTDVDLDGDGATELLAVVGATLLLFAGSDVVGGVPTAVARSRIDFSADNAGLLSDMTGDGVPDLWAVREAGNSIGDLRIYSGADAIAGTLPEDALASVLAETVNIGFGAAVLSVGDLDGDGIPEVAISAIETDP